jgi:predicted short-subunit dehydrogenase-like oxidoreductase (DUF2520 family)
MSSPPRISFVGTGPVVRALAAAYVGGRGEVAVVVSRDPGRAAHVANAVGAGRGSSDVTDALASDVVVVAVADRALPEVAEKIAAAAATARPLLLHTSGALSAEVFSATKMRAGSLHPLQSFPDADDDSLLLSRVLGAHWFHEGDGFDEAAEMTTVWGGTLHRLAPGGKALYHAGAAVASNHAVALFDAALALFEAAGVPRAEAHAPLAALTVGTTANIVAAGVPAALTGPIARGDVDTVRRHLDAIRAGAPDLLESYAAMAKRTLVVARRKGAVAPGHADAIERLLA